MTVWYFCFVDDNRIKNEYSSSCDRLQEEVTNSLIETNQKRFRL